jgi:alkylated DNA nucleotide flippase Atl1
MRPDPEEYVELVLSVVEEIPRGRVTSYGAIASVVGGGPRQVGAVLARHGGPVPWWRVVRADGSLPPSHEHDARPHYLDEGTPLRASGAVDMVRAFWEPEPPVLPADGSRPQPGPVSCAQIGAIGGDPDRFCG